MIQRLRHWQRTYLTAGWMESERLGQRNGVWVVLGNYTVSLKFHRWNRMKEAA